MSTLKSKFISAPVNGPTVEPLVIQTNNLDRVTVDSSGNVGVGTSSPSLLRMTIESSGGQLRIRNSNTRYRSDWVVGSAGDTEINSYDDTGNVYRPLRLDANPLIFNISGTERARIDSNGYFLIGTSSAGGNGFSFYPSIAPNANTSYIVFNRANTASAGTVLQFQNNGTIVGSITHNNTATAYNTSSDYRLKHDIQPMSGALAKVAALKPVTYKWNVDDSDGEGFIAHELAEVCPGAVTGEKDAVNEDGSIKPQGIDTSFLVATLTAAIQELKAELDATKAEVAALKAQS